MAWERGYVPQPYGIDSGFTLLSAYHTLLAVPVFHCPSTTVLAVLNCPPTTHYWQCFTVHLQQYWQWFTVCL